MLVAIYVRISQENPDDYSLADQEQRCRAHAEAQGWEVVRVYVDDGLSGRRWDRLALQRMLAALQPLGIGVVLVYDLDRAMRKLKYQLQLKDELDARRVILISLADGVIDTSTPEGILRFQAKGMVNEYQANTTARKVRDNLAYKAKQSGWVGQWPIGYEKDDQGRLVPSADAPVVVLIFELYASGAYTDTAGTRSGVEARAASAGDAEILTRAEYERKRKALLATARTPVAPAAVNEARALTRLADIPTLIAAAKPSEQRAVVGALFEKVWIQAKGIIAVTPRSDVGPLLAGLARVRYGCLDGVPGGHQ